METKQVKKKEQSDCCKAPAKLFPKGYRCTKCKNLCEIVQSASKEAKTSKAKTLQKKPEERMTGKNEVYAFTITDRAFGEFKVLNSANGWWIDRTKVQRLIDAYKIDGNDDEACAYAGISLKQLEYFKEIHPDFSGVKHACYQILPLKAKQALALKVEQDPEWYLERKRKDEYSPRVEQTGANGRELFEGMSEDFRRLTEAIAKRYEDEREDTEEHADGAGTGNAPAGSGRAEHETSSAGGPVGQEDTTAQVR